MDARAHVYTYEPESIVSEMQKSEVGRAAVKTIENTDVNIIVCNDEYYTGVRGITIGNTIILYQNNIY